MLSKPRPNNYVDRVKQQQKKSIMDEMKELLDDIIEILAVSFYSSTEGQRLRDLIRGEQNTKDCIFIMVTHGFSVIETFDQFEDEDLSTPYKGLQEIDSPRDSAYYLLIELQEVAENLNGLEDDEAIEYLTEWIESHTP